MTAQVAFRTVEGGRGPGDASAAMPIAPSPPRRSPRSLHAKSALKDITKRITDLMRQLHRRLPDLATSGNIVRHGINRGGDRRLNRALQMAVVTQMRVGPSTHVYLERRTRRSDDLTNIGVSTGSTSSTAASPATCATARTTD